MLCLANFIRISNAFAFYSHRFIYLHQMKADKSAAQAVVWWICEMCWILCWAIDVLPWLWLCAVRLGGLDLASIRSWFFFDGWRHVNFPGVLLNSNQLLKSVEILFSLLSPILCTWFHSMLDLGEKKAKEKYRD